VQNRNYTSNYMYTLEVVWQFRSIPDRWHLYSDGHVKVLIHQFIHNAY